MKRFTRQIRLPEVGEDGQARICAARPALRCAGFAAEIERAYLVAAGARPGDGDGDGNGNGNGVRDARAREVYEGAMAALVTLKEIL